MSLNKVAICLGVLCLISGAIWAVVRYCSVPAGPVRPSSEVKAPAADAGEPEPQGRGIAPAAVKFNPPPTRMAPLPAIPTAGFQAAATQFEKIYKRKPTRLDTLSLLGDAVFRAENWPLAVTCFAEIPVTHPRYGVAARYQQAEALLRMQRVRQAERCYLEVVQQPHSPYTVSALFQLVFLYSVQLREEQQHAALEQLLATGEAELDDALKYCFPSLHRWNGSAAVTNLEKMWKTDPGDFRLQVALAKYRIGQGRLEEAHAILKFCCKNRPQDLHAQAAMLFCLHEQGRWQEMAPVIEQLPEDDGQPPWLLLRMKGASCEQQNRYEDAAENYRQLLQKLPTDAASNLRLSQVYLKLGREKDRAKTLERARALARIQNRLGWVAQETGDPAPLAEIIKLSHKADLTSTAQRVLKASLKVHPQAPALLELQKTLAPANAGN